MTDDGWLMTDDGIRKRTGKTPYGYLSDAVRLQLEAHCDSIGGMLGRTIQNPEPFTGNRETAGGRMTDG
jgi:hypothetical protein